MQVRIALALASSKTYYAIIKVAETGNGSSIHGGETASHRMRKPHL